MILKVYGNVQVRVKFGNDTESITVKEDVLKFS